MRDVNAMTERIVAVESSSAITSLAVADDGVVVVEAEHRDPRGHVEAIGALFAASIAPVLADGQPVTGVVCGVGPGPYSGLRVGVAYARALALAWQVPIVGVCSLDALAAASPSPRGCLVTADARRNEVYWARYDGASTRVAGPLVGPAAGLPSDLTVVDRPARARDLLEFLALHDARSPLTWSPDPVNLDLDAHGDSGERTQRALAGRTLLTPEPLYLRGADVTVPARGTWAHPVSAGVRWT